MARAQDVPAAAPFDVEGFKRQLDLLFKAAEFELESIEREQVEVNALQRSLGSDPVVLIDWVRKNTRFVPYVGALKGARGTLLARQGNGLDRGVLAAELLRLAGLETRIVRAAPPESALDDLLERARKSAGSAAPPAAPLAAPADPEIEGLANHLGLEAPEVRALIAKSQFSGEQLLAEMHNLLAEHEASLLEVLGDRMPAADDAAREAAWRKALAHHYWVQARPTGAQVWRDYDLLYPEGVPDHLRAGVETAAPAHLPDPWVHQVRLKVVARVVENAEAAASDHVLLEHRFRCPDEGPIELAVQFTAAEMASPETVWNGSEKEGAPAFWAKEFARHETWGPVLVLPGQEPITQRAFTRGGAILEDLPGAYDKVRKALEGATGLLAGLGEPPAEAPTPVPGRVMEVRIDWEVICPGEEALRFERHLYREDPTHDAERRQRVLAAAMTRETSVLIQGGHIPRDYASLLGAERLLKSRLPIQYQVRQIEAEADPGETIGRIAGRPLELSPQNVFLAASRRNADGSFLAQPNLLTSWSEIAWNEVGEPVMRQLVDIVWNHTASVAAASVRQVLRNGLWDSIVETACSDSVELTSSAAYGLRGRKLRLIAQQSELASLGVEADLERALEADLSRGFLVAVAREPDKGEALWWRIDPQTGNTLGMILYEGRVAGGSPQTEYTIKLYNGVVWLIGAGRCILGRSTAAGGLACIGCALAMRAIGASRAIMSLMASAAWGTMNTGMGTCGAIVGAFE